MKKISAFSLIEVIVSLAVIGILAVGMLPVMSGGLRFLNKSKEITQNIFDAQKEMELAIESAKSHSSGLTPKTMTLFTGHDIEVTYFEITSVINGKKYSTLVSENRPEEYESLGVSGVKAVANNDLNLKSVASTTGNQIDARHDPITDVAYFKTVFQWYISKKGFNIPNAGGVIPENEVGTIYPAFPYDYEPLPYNFDTRRLTNLETFSGKHVIFTATPASIYGKLGTLALSNSIYVQETVLPDKLLVQMDASLIDEQDSNQVRTSNGTSYVKKWINFVSTNRSAIQNTDNRQPVVKTNLPQVDYIGKYLDFSTNDSNDRLELTNYVDIRNKALSLYMVVRGEANSVISHSSTTIHVSDSGTNPNNAELTPLGNGWKIAKKNYTTLGNNAAENITIGNVDLDIAEILVYSQLNETEEIDVIKYLVNKYKMYTPNDQINALHDFYDEVYRDESYTLPASVLATFADGNTSYVPVTWTDLTYAPGSIVDTSIVRTLNFIGVATNDHTKEVRFRLTIKPVTQLTSLTITPISNPLDIDDQLTMAFTYQPANATLQTIKWLSSDVDVATIDAKTGALRALTKGRTMITVQANGLTSSPYEVEVGESVPVVIYLKEWNFNNGVEGWSQTNISGFSSVDNSLRGTPSTDTNSYINITNLNQKVNKESKIEIRMKNNSDATSIRIRFRNTDHNNFNQGDEKTFSISANDSDFKTYSFDFSDLTKWADSTNNLNHLRIYPTFDDKNESFNIDYIKITE